MFVAKTNKWIPPGVEYHCNIKAKSGDEHGTLWLQFVRVLPKVRYGTKFKLCISLALLENQIVIQYFVKRVQPSLIKLSSNVTGMVLLMVGHTLHRRCVLRVSAAVCCHCQHRLKKCGAVLTDQLEFCITHMGMQTQERKHYKGGESKLSSKLF